MKALSLRSILLAIPFIMLSGVLSGQSSKSNLSGKVTDELKLPLPGASVALLDLTGKVMLQTATDSSGSFSLSYPGKGNFMLRISSLAFKEYRSEAFVLSDRDFGVIALLPVAIGLKDVIVQAKENVIELDGSSIVFNVNKSISSQGVSALEALKKAPGVFVENESTITLNGKQGALIMLDGKPTYLSGKEMIDLLKAMPSSGIKSIEIINSPTAKYDASGSAGIINIRTNKSQIRGFTGTVTTGLSYGMTLKQNQDLGLNYRTDKLNVYGNYSHFLGHYKYLYGTNRIQNGKAYNSHTDDTDKRNKMGARLGADYYLDKKHVIGFLINSNFILGGGRTDTKTIIGLPRMTEIEQTLDAFNDYYEQQTERYNFNLNYKYEDSVGNILNIDADYGLFDKWNANLQSNIYKDARQVELSSNLNRTFNGIDIEMKGIKVDYTSKLWGGLLETGAKFTAVGSMNDSRFLHVKPSLDSLDERRTNSFLFDERISGGYVNYKRSLGKWVLQGGLRLENSASEGSLNFKENGIDRFENIKRNYANLFPSFSVMVKPKDNHSMSLAYSRRIERPAYQDLNPFRYMLDELSFWQGNPFLRPQLAHRINFQYAYKGSTIIGLNYAHTDQYSAGITDTVEQDKIVIVARNLGIQRNLSLSLTQTASPTRWWDATLNGMVYYVQNDIELEQYRNLDLQQLAGRMSLQQTFKLPFRLTGEVTSILTTRRLTGASNFSRGIRQVDLGLQKKLLGDKATLRIVINDIHKGNQSRSTQNFEGFYSQSYGYYESRQVRLNFSYRFANGSVKAPRNRNSALDSESGRIK